MKPICRLRNAACARSPSVNGSCPSRVTVPDDGGSSAPRMYRSVLLPLPDGPMIATASPRSSDSEMPERTVSAPRGVGYDFATSFAISMWSFRNGELWNFQEPWRSIVVSTPKKDQPPTPKMSGGESRNDFHPAGSRHAPWELGVGDWELTRLPFSAACGGRDEVVINALDLFRHAPRGVVLAHARCAGGPE